MTIEMFAAKIPAELLLQSGAVFYSGRKAFSTASALYVLGVNPGGDPESHKADTVGSHTAAVLHIHADDWSAYRDESWKDGFPPGTYGMAPRVLHMLAGLNLSADHVPSSNLVFVRSRREGAIGRDMNLLADLCWPFHSFVIESLQPRAILCFGKTAGNYVRRKVVANTLLIPPFVEDNNRRWENQAFVNSAGLRVVVATHPSIADWCAASTDPTQLVREALR
jgi:hypothetical protein